MTRIPVVSTCITSVGYLEGERVLEVEFIRGEVYRYFNVPAEDYALLLAAESKGQHVNQGIKPRFASVRVSS